MLIEINIFVGTFETYGCAMQRTMKSLVEPGRTGRRVLGSPNPPGCESKRGKQHVGKAENGGRRYAREVPQDPHPRARARLPEVQSPCGAISLPSEIVWDRCPALAAFSQMTRPTFRAVGTGQ